MFSKSISKVFIPSVNTILWIYYYLWVEGLHKQPVRNGLPEGHFNGTFTSPGAKSVASRNFMIFSAHRNIIRQNISAVGQIATYLWSLKLKNDFVDKFLKMGWQSLRSQNEALAPAYWFFWRWDIMQHVQINWFLWEFCLHTIISKYKKVYKMSFLKAISRSYYH